MKTTLLLVLLLGAASLHAAGLTTPAGNRLDWTLPHGWQRAIEPPPALVENLERQFVRDALRDGKSPTRQQLHQAALERLAANELLLYHPQSGAWIGFDFSPLRDDERQPDAAAVELSARYALDSLRSEAEIEQLQGEVQPLPLPGAPATHYLHARYRQHGVVTGFDGLVGALPGEWFFIYATSYPGRAELLAQIKALFASLRFTPRASP